MKLYLRILLFAVAVCLPSYPLFARTTTPEQYGAVGDGMANDTKAVIAALNNGDIVVFSRVYKVDYIRVPHGRRLISDGSAAILYYAIDVYDDCSIERITFDGGWHTRGMQILGSNVTIDGCRFINTKGTLEYYGGLTSAIWIGRYQDLDAKRIKYNGITIKNCFFSKCEPIDSISKISNNKNVARFILSYGCKGLKISTCTFEGLKGTFDSDAIQLCSYAIKSSCFPFDSYNDSWTSKNTPYLGLYYSNCKTTIEKCTFLQDKSKSSIKIMSSGVNVIKNRFVLLNTDNDNASYSVVRAHFTKDVIIRDNVFVIDGNASESIVKLGNCKNVVVEKNGFTSSAKAKRPPVVFDATYTSGCKFKKNTIKYETIGSLLTLEFNDNLQININTVEAAQVDDGTLKLFSPLTNHYSYPPRIYTKSRIEYNRFVFRNWNGNSFDISNKYDFPLLFKSNKVKRNGVSEKIKYIL